MPIIVSLRGTHGSGKSSIAKTILETWPNEPDYSHFNNDKKPDGYTVALPGNKSLYVVGSYKNACGGCDGIQPYELIWPRIVTAHSKGHHVFFEGAIVSSSYGNIGRASEYLGDEMVFAFLDTPLDLCLERIKARREAKGGARADKPVSLYWPTSKHESVQKSIVKIRDTFKRRVVMVPHTAPVKSIVKLYGVSLRKEPKVWI